MAASELNLIFTCKDFNCVTDGIWISGVIFMQLVGMVCFYVGGGGHVAHIDGCASWFYSMRLMLGFFKLRSESAIRVAAGSEWLDDGIFTVHCFMLGVMISKLIQV